MGKDEGKQIWHKEEIKNREEVRGGEERKSRFKSKRSRRE